MIILYYLYLKKRYNFKSLTKSSATHHNKDIICSTQLPQQWSYPVLVSVAIDHGNLHLMIQFNFSRFLYRMCTQSLVHIYPVHSVHSSTINNYSLRKMKWGKYKRKIIRRCGFAVACDAYRILYARVRSVLVISLCRDDGTKFTLVSVSTVILIYQQ